MKEVKEGEIISRVYINKISKQKLITIPKECNINSGDYVKITKLKLIENES